MNYLKISENEYVELKGSPMSLFIYNREFDRDINSDLYEAFADGVVINESLASKITWTLCKTNDNNTLSYQLWKKIINYKLLPNWGEIVFAFCKKTLEIVIDESEFEDSDLNEAETKQKITAREMTISILATSKKMGLSFDELNFLTVNDYYELLDAFSNNKKDLNRKATQEDIDNLFA